MDNRLVIVDDYFPNIISSFRLHEYNYYMDNIPDTIIFSCDGEFDRHLKEYSLLYPDLASNIRPFGNNNIRSKIGYCIFINNAYSYLGFFEKNAMPFIFTLYPGGGFEMEQEQTKIKISVVLNHNLCKKVIVTQPITMEYLLKNFSQHKDKIVYIAGGVAPLFDLNNLPKKKKYPQDKPNIDICFTAAKCPKKGWEEFSRVVDILGKDDRFKFHVVGGFNINDRDFGNTNIKYYGWQETSFFDEFYSNIDILVSPTKIFRAKLRSDFDGFPTGCSVEAGLHGVVNMCTDPMNSNNGRFADNEIVIINTNPQDICDKIIELCNNVEKLYEIGECGQKAMLREYSEEKQLLPRIKILKEFIER